MNEGKTGHSFLIEAAVYLYRCRAWTRGERSKRIYRRAPAKTMKRDYLAFHTLDPDLAIDDLIEIQEQRHLRKQ